MISGYVSGLCICCFSSLTNLLKTSVSWLHTSYRDIGYDIIFVVYTHCIKKPERQFILQPQQGVSNHWTGIWNGMMERKMECNSKRTQLQLTRVTAGAALGLFFHRKLCKFSITNCHASISKHGTSTAVLIIRCFSLKKPDSCMYEKHSLPSWDYC